MVIKASKKKWRLRWKMQRTIPRIYLINILKSRSVCHRETVDGSTQRYYIGTRPQHGVEFVWNWSGIEWEKLDQSIARATVRWGSIYNWGWWDAYMAPRLEFTPGQKRQPKVHLGDHRVCSRWWICKLLMLVKKKQLTILFESNDDKTTTGSWSQTNHSRKRSLRPVPKGTFVILQALGKSYNQTRKTENRKENNNRPSSQ